jgi:hypothetical protein
VMATGRNRAGIATAKKVQNSASVIVDHPGPANVSELGPIPMSADHLPRDRPVRP